MSSRLRPRSGSVRQAGFSTLEVIATVLVLAAGLIPLFDAMTNIQRNARLIARNELRNTSLTDAFEYLRSVNVGVTNSGEVSFDAWSLTWKAEPLPTPPPPEEDQDDQNQTDVRPAATLPEHLSVRLEAGGRRRVVTLYKVTAKITIAPIRDTEPLVETVDLHMVGWEDGP